MSTKVPLIKATLNGTGASHCEYVIKSGYVDKESPWSFSAEDGDKLLGPNGDNWSNYAQWFLGVDSTADPGTKARYKYPYGKEGKVYRSALVAIRSRASANSDDAVFAAAGKFIDAIDATKAYGEKALDMRQKAWSKFEVKTVDNELRILTGVATTPTPDRMADVVEPDGAEFDLPLPFLWQHDSLQPIGEVTAAKPGKKGIPVTIKIIKIDEPGTLKARVDEAWQSIKARLVKGLSIGFAPIEYSFIEKTGGIHFTKWMWLELSAVTIPANAEASIAVIKSCDAPPPRTILKLGRVRAPMSITVPKEVGSIEEGMAAGRRKKAGDYLESVSNLTQEGDGQ